MEKSEILSGIAQEIIDLKEENIRLHKTLIQKNNAIVFQHFVIGFMGLIVIIKHWF